MSIFKNDLFIDWNKVETLEDIKSYEYKNIS